MLKAQFHVHAYGDPVDHIPYTPKTLIKRAATLGYEVLSITCHRKLLFNTDLKKYAQKLGILLIPGIEFEINKKHILGINVDKEIEQVDTFEKLRAYKSAHPECLIIAPHPFFPGKIALQKDLLNNIDLFDAIEYSFFYHKKKNYNEEAEKVAKRWKKPLIATSDCHILEHLDAGFSLLDATKNTKSVIDAVKKGKFQNITNSSSYFKLGKILLKMTLQNLFKPRAI